MPTVVIIGALDTKGPELKYLADAIAAKGHRPVLMDIGVLGEPAARADVPRSDVAAAAGTSIAALATAGDRGAAMKAMAEGAAVVARRLAERGELDAIVGMGGGAGTSVATAAMRALPLGIPKLMISTLAAGDTRPFLGVKDIVMVPSIVDIAGLNRISRGVIARAAAAVAAMVDTTMPSTGTDRPLVAASMFGNTTQCVDTARALIEARGYEVLVFHAVGTGGQTMEGLIESGAIAKVFDATLTEWADELVGGVMSAGPTRLEAAARAGVPAVIAPGCLDMVNFWAIDTVPAHLKHRRLYQHNANVTLLRTNPDENAELGHLIADKLNFSVGPVELFLPLKGVSVVSAPGGPFHWPEADAALFSSLKRHLRPDIPVHEMDTVINDPAFATAMAEALLRIES
jgi:uncharacterized protein (UPF0261 family)